MTTPDTTARSGGGVQGRRRTRALAIVAATVAALVVWALARYALGIDVFSPEGPQPSFEIGPANVVFASVGAGAAGWALLALLERFVARAYRVWLVVAVLFAALSLLGPLLGAGLEPANRAVLVVLHVTVAAIVVPPFYRTSREKAQAAEAQTGS